jgi:hypothetical protein
MPLISTQFFTLFPDAISNIQVFEEADEWHCSAFDKRGIEFELYHGNKDTAMQLLDKLTERMASNSEIVTVSSDGACRIVR